MRRVAEKSESACKAKVVAKNVAAAAAKAAVWPLTARQQGNTARAEKKTGASAGTAVQMLRGSKSGRK